MKVSKQWIEEWVASKLDAREMAHTLTMAGLEVDSVEPVAAPLDKVVVGKVLSVEPHPNADRLRVCKVDVGKARPVQIVCGAANVTEGASVPAALVGASLPNGMVIKAAELRGVKSSGMLCSAAELGLAEEADGLLLLEGSPKPGTPVTRFLGLDDHSIDIDLTPNRGDCLSIAGIARELSALTGARLKQKTWPKAKVSGKRKLTVQLKAKADCPRYVGRVVEGIDPKARTPLWMQEKLRRCGLRPIHPVVDITNLVMLELGQPMHGFDLNKLTAPISVRRAKKGERMTLLDGQKVTVPEGALLIADKQAPVALAGIMGGLDSAVDDTTTDIFFESAFFSRDAIAGRARELGLHTDSSHRFERGVDPALQEQAIEYATRLLLEIAGGKAGPLVKAESREHLPKRKAIALQPETVNDLIGMKLGARQVETSLTRLGMKLTKAAKGGWRVTPPSHRFDIEREVDLIEEVARVHGYDNIPPKPIAATLEMAPMPDGVLLQSRCRHALVDRDLLEVVTYSFIDPDIQSLVDPQAKGIRLANPISEDMAVMRSSLWPGLLTTARYNLHRQQQRVRLFELGHRFHRSAKGKITEVMSLAGLITGPAAPAQWGEASRGCDFFDLKGDLEAVLDLAGLKDRVQYEKTAHPALHPGQGAQISLDGVIIGQIGAIHPGLLPKLDLEQPVYVFEIDFSALEGAFVPAFSPISRFPSIRRDLAVLIDREIPAQKVLDCATKAAGDWLTDLELFDDYRGEGIDSGRKSLALGLTLQDSSRTLKEAAVQAVMDAVVDALKKELGAEPRS